MKKLTILFSIAILTVLTFSTQKISAHCQIPCGIYDDEARFVLLLEHCTTLEKSMNQINELSANSEKNYNQIVRWVNNKEHHADDLTDIVVDYFMMQRVKEVTVGEDGYDVYVKKVTLLHKMTRLAMACKQTTELSNVTSLRTAVEEFKTLYTGK